MKRIRITLMTLAVAAAVCSAFATKSDPLCYDCPQYYLSGGVYYPAGVKGYNYDCDEGSAANTCTFYKPIDHPNEYWGCNLGVYIYIQGIKDNKNQAAKK